MYEALISLLIVMSWVDGFFIAFALCNQQNQFWLSYLDGRSLRILWGKRRYNSQATPKSAPV